MRFFYRSSNDLLGVRFRPGPAERAHRRHEVMPQVFMDFDAKGNLAQIEIQNASAHQPDLKDMIQNMVQAVMNQAEKLSQEATLAIEKTLRLSTESDDKQPLSYSPGFNFDALNNVLIVNLLAQTQLENLLPKQQVLPHTYATFNEDGYLISLEIQAAMQQFPDLRQFVEQGQQMLAMQNMFKF